MLDSAMPPKLRTPEVRALVAAAEAHNAPLFAQLYEAYPDTAITPKRPEQIEEAKAGNQDALTKLYGSFLARCTTLMTDKKTPIGDPETITLLQRQRTRVSEARVQLYQRLQDRLTNLLKTHLYPNQQSQAGAGSPVNTSTAPTDTWVALVHDAGGAAERLWRDYLLDIDPSKKQKLEVGVGSLDITAYWSHLIWLLWLEASLYQQRSDANSGGQQMSGGGFGHENPTRKDIRVLMDTYFDRMRQWDKELKALTKQRFFLKGFLDSEQLRRLIKQFGEASPEEVGWLSQAEDAQAELRYQLRDEIVRELWRNHRWFSSAALWLLGFTTGYGTRPRNFVITAASVVGVDALLFFLNDLLNPGIPAATHGTLFCAAARPHFTSWVDVVTFIIRYLYLAVTNITSLGSDASLATYCGGLSTQILLIATTITGYILLGLLVSLFFRLLIEAN